MRLLVGSMYNLLARGPSAVVVSDADALYPLVNLSDGLPSNMFRFGSNGADRQITKDLNEVTNGGLETSTLASWINRSTGTGSIAETTVGAEVHSGSKAAKLGGGSSGVGMITQDILVRAGERRFADVWLRGDGTRFIRYQILNLTTGRYLQAGGASWGAAADLFTRSAATYAQSTQQYQVESLDVCQADTVTLRLIAHCNENGFGFIDDISDSAVWNLCAVFGHNHAPVVVPQLRSSTDGFSANDVLEATLTPYQPSYFSFLSSAAAKRHVRFKLLGTNVATPWCGEVVVGYAESALRGPNYGAEFPLDHPQLRSDGNEYVFSLMQKPMLGLDGEIRYPGSAALLEARELIARAVGGLNPILVVPVDNERAVILGRIEPRWVPKRDTLSISDVPFVIRPFPMPSIVA